MKRHILGDFIIFCSGLLLTACSSMNSNFDCPNKVGVLCKNLDQINEMVDRGQIQGQSHTVSNTARDTSTASTFQPFMTVANNYSGAPLRYGETVQRIWVAPFEDTEGNYHQDSVIYAIVKEGHWLGQPIKASIKS